MSHQPNDPGCACRVSYSELTARIGWGGTLDPEQFVEEVRRMTGIETAAAIGPGWDGAPSLPTEVASEVLIAVREVYDANDAKHNAYRLYLEEREAAARAEREKAWLQQQEAQRKERERRRLMTERELEQQREATRKARQEEEARQAAKRGNPTPFSEFDLTEWERQRGMSA